ncbi:hypothetical protein [Neorhizobium galegae]|uniref:hypothetical protein n=1 Tax=Neorhizobium galegae TaxID=399 RepID=UPI00127F6BF1|nr:hypothetical protein [Neorhizobium galegae]KAA9383194.1 hypothetical protein F4V88_22905 [Neorhizobium galegae]KAB1109206.1 hypothetical protein F4V89_28035 [Neorhizobium galegae]MCM2497610.1 hypothetical protein [Neorhizobium galegae]
MRFIASLLFLFPASTAMAVMLPGPPPWSCSVSAACNAANMCVRLITLPIQFKLTQVEGDAKKYHLVGYDGYERAALEFPGLEDAERFAKTYSSAEPTPFILIRNDKIADAHGFWLYTISQRGSGQRILTDEKMLVACSSIRKK